MPGSLLLGDFVGREPWSLTHCRWLKSSCSQLPPFLLPLMEVSSLQVSPSYSRLGTPPLRPCLWSGVIYSGTQTSHNRQINTQTPFQRLLWERGFDPGPRCGRQGLSLQLHWVAVCPEIRSAPKSLSAFDSVSVSVFISQFCFVWIRCPLIKGTPQEHAWGQGDVRVLSVCTSWVWARFPFPPWRTHFVSDSQTFFLQWKCNIMSLKSQWSARGL